MLPGFYCPNGTRSATDYPCAAGTYNNITTLTSQSECFDCIAGHYCPGGAVIEPYLLCSAGFYCRSGAETSTPMEDADAYECPRGYYCVEGTAEPIHCPVGTFSNSTRLRNETDCTSCTPGHYCDSLHQTETTGLCDPGYFCVEGSIAATSDACPMGFYCPLGTHIPFRCPNSTWSNDTHLTSAVECTECPAGWYCQSSGLTAPEGLCQQGYYCPAGSNVPNPVVCPIGLHCPEGADEPEACMSGYYTNRTGACFSNPKFHVMVTVDFLLLLFVHSFSSSV